MKDSTIKSIPFSITLPEIPQTEDNLTDTELHTKLQHSYEQSLEGKGRPFNNVFDDLEKDSVKVKQSPPQIEEPHRQEALSFERAILHQ